jgi:hypothetical protein
MLACFSVLFSDTFNILGHTACMLGSIMRHELIYYPGLRALTYKKRFVFLEHPMSDLSNMAICFSTGTCDVSVGISMSRNQQNGLLIDVSTKLIMCLHCQKDTHTHTHTRLKVGSFITAFQLNTSTRVLRATARLAHAMSRTASSHVTKLRGTQKIAKGFLFTNKAGRTCYLQGRKWRQSVPPKHSRLLTNPHGVTTPKINTDTSVRGERAEGSLWATKRDRKQEKTLYQRISQFVSLIITKYH